MAAKADLDCLVQGLSSYLFMKLPIFYLFFICHDLYIYTLFAAYNPPTPPKPKPGTHNDHRYFIYVFQQGHVLDSNAEVKSRKNFDIDAYMEDFDLKPVAMNMFRTHS